MFLDTHIVCWLYEGKTEKLSPSAIQLIEDGELLVSQMVRLELQYLYEIGRIAKGPDEIMASLNEEIGLNVNDRPFSDIVSRACELHWTRDPFDRIITAEALAGDSVLITKDNVIRENCDKAIW